MTKRILAILLGLLLILSLQSVRAEGVNYIEYTWDEEMGILSSCVQSCPQYTLLKEGDTTWNTGWYVASGHVSISISKSVTVSGDARLILTDGCYLSAGRGIRVVDGGSLTIFAQSEGDGMGELYAEAYYNTGDAGIGGEGRVIIHGGNISAFGDQGGGGAGIGSCSSPNKSRISSCDVTIFGGRISAYGRGGGAGIGSGVRSASSVTICGGTISASKSGAFYGTGIGSGGESEGSTVILNGGEITTNEIGGSYNGSAGTIAISGGTVHAKRIGAGNRGKGGDIHISGGSVTADRIDVGWGNGGGSVTISGGDLTLSVPRDGDNTSTAIVSREIAISGGSVSVTAKSWDGGILGNTVDISGGILSVHTSLMQAIFASTIRISGGQVCFYNGGSFYPAMEGDTIQFCWSQPGDSIFVSSFDKDSLSISLTAPFQIAGTDTLLEEGVVQRSSIQGKMLVPPIDGESYKWHGADFTLPASLENIESDAFAKIAATAVMVPRLSQERYQLQHIGADVFSGSSVKYIRFLGDTVTFDADAFAGCGPIVVFAPAGSTTFNNLLALENIKVVPLP